MFNSLLNAHNLHKHSRFESSLIIEVTLLFGFWQFLHFSRTCASIKLWIFCVPPVTTKGTSPIVGVSNTNNWWCDFEGYSISRVLDSLPRVEYDLLISWKLFEIWCIDHCINLIWVGFYQRFASNWNAIIFALRLKNLI